MSNINFLQSQFQIQAQDQQRQKQDQQKQEREDREDEKWMREALKRANWAAKRGEVPVGAVLVKDGKLFGWGQNCRERTSNPLGHAEILALLRASKKLNSWRLEGCTLYSTLEPCVLCAGAMIQGRIDRLVYGAKDPKGGAVDSLLKLGQDPRFHHCFHIKSGVLAAESSQLLKDFFKKLRIEKDKTSFV